MVLNRVKIEKELEKYSKYISRAEFSGEFYKFLTSALIRSLITLQAGLKTGIWILEGRGPFLEIPGNLPGPLSTFLNVFSPIRQRLQTWYFANVFIE